MLAYQQDEYKMWTELIRDVNAAYDKGKEECQLQAQQLRDAKALNEQTAKGSILQKAKLWPENIKP